MTPAPPFPSIPDYPILRCLGVGGMGVVYLAKDELHHRELVALKTLRFPNSAGWSSLSAEWRVLADIVHPNLVLLHELSERGGHRFFTMEVVPGFDFVTDALTDGAGHPSADQGRVQPGVPAPMRAERTFDDTLPDLVLDGSPEAFAPLSAPIAPLERRIQRLRRTLPGLVAGVQHLHAHDKLHLDLKPNNVIVRPDGTAVIIDLGLAQEVGLQGQSVAGSLLYIAPERLTYERLTPATDWYSVGVMLYAALTGWLPHGGDREQITAARTGMPAPSPRAREPGLPDDLVRLVEGLLRRDPAERLDGDAILAWAGRHPLAVQTPPGPRARRRFFGRRSERRVLQAALADVVAGQARVVLLHGESGIGKSALVRQFLDDVEQQSGAWVLDGRCHERETVPFNAFERMMEPLVKAVLSCRQEGWNEHLPPGLDGLARIFPALGALLPRKRAAPVDPDDPLTRRRAFDALRELLAELANRRPLVLFMDDLQWGDRDSGRLLRVILDADKPVPMLFLGAFRTREEDRSPFLAAASLVDAERVAIGPLGAEDARAMAVHLASERQDGRLVDVDRITAETGANPFFLEQVLLARRAGPAASVDPVHDLLVSRFAELEPAARAVLEIVALAGEPVRQDAVSRVSGAGARGGELLQTLRHLRLVRTYGTYPSDPVECEHDRIREAMVSTLPMSVAVQIHQRMCDDTRAHAPGAVEALGLLSSRVAPDATTLELAVRALPLVRHLNAAWDLDPSCVAREELLRWNLAAGRASQASGAYGTAARFFARAVRLVVPTAASPWRDPVAREAGMAWVAAQHLDADFEGVLASSAPLLATAVSLEERIPLLEHRIRALIALQRMADAIDVAVDALGLLGVRLPRHATKAGQAGAALRLWALMWRMPPARIAALPVMTDTSALAAMRIMRCIITPCFVAEPDLFPLLGVEMVTLTVRLGVSPDSPTGLVASAIFAVATGGADTGIALGECALHIVERLGASAQIPAVEGVRGGFLVHWREPVTASYGPLARAWEAGASVGDFEFASMGAVIGAYNRWFAGEPLMAIQRFALAHQRQLDRFGQERSRADITRLLQLTANLLGQEEGPAWVLRGRYYDIDQVLARQMTTGDRSHVASLRYFQGLLAWWFEDLEVAAAHLATAAPDIEALPATLNFTAFYLLEGLVAAAKAPPRRGLFAWRLPGALWHALLRYRRWARLSPVNHAPAYALLQAEAARLRGADREAARCYDVASSGAEAAGALPLLAMSLEAEARFWLASDAARAQACWDRALAAWSRWGAVAIVSARAPAPAPWASRAVRALEAAG